MVVPATRARDYEGRLRQLSVQYNDQAFAKLREDQPDRE